MTGNLFIVSAPSGGGKTSLVKKLAASLDGLVISISHTTRPMRPGEQDGVDYFFVDKQKFTTMVEENAFIEYAHVFNQLYGTSKEQINQRLKQGIDVVLDIDWQGALQIKRIFPDSVRVFVVPPSLEELKNRLVRRRQDDEAVVGDRMRRAQDEMSHYNEFDYLLVNDDFETAAQELIAIVLANRLRLERQIKKQEKLLSFLLAAQ